ncbi:fungal-specific transcription factor [Trichoderma austrokoningii]
MARRVIAPGHSCLECRRRKIKCDRALPCSYCARIKLQCSYPSWRPNRSSSRESDLAAKVQALECTLQSLEQKITRVRDLSHCDTTGGIYGADSLHPPSSSIAFIWQTYLDAVDPLLKIFHVPSVQRHVMSMSQGREMPNAATECLMFAIYYSTVITISVAECREEFGEEKLRLLQILQAFVIYLICGRLDENGPDVYTLIGLVIGNAMELGLHIDIPGMSSFEVEMRRRLCEPFIIEPSLHTELPLNINDTSLDPHIGELSPQSGRSEMLFSLVRCEVSHFSRRIYLSHCHEAIPLDCLTAMSCRLILAKLKLAHNKERRWLWLFQYIEWDALAYLLLDVCITFSSSNQTSNGSAAAAWEAVNGSYNHWKSSPYVNRDRRWMKVEELYSNALSVLERTQGVTQTRQTTEAHDQSENLSDDAAQMQQHYESSPGSVLAEEAQSFVNTIELPGAGTACEWSVSLIEAYWDVAGLGNEGL